MIEISEAKLARVFSKTLDSDPMSSELEIDASLNRIEILGNVNADLLKACEANLWWVGFAANILAEFGWDVHADKLWEKVALECAAIAKAKGQEE